MYLSSRDTDDILFCPIQAPGQLEGSPCRQTFQIYVLGQADKPCIDISFSKCLGVIVYTYNCRTWDMKTGGGGGGRRWGGCQEFKVPSNTTGYIAWTEDFVSKKQTIKNSW